MSRAADLQRLKRTTSSGFYCGNCRTRNPARCRCQLGCSAQTNCRRTDTVETRFGPRCPDHMPAEPTP